MADTDENSADKAGSWNSSGVETKIYKCHKFDCDFETRELLRKCPQCGWTLLDPVAVRTLGVVLAVLGGILALGGAALFAAPKIQKGGAIKYAVIGVFIALLAAGSVATVAGLKQAVSANKSGRLIAVMAAIIVVLVLVAAFVRILA